MASKKIHNEIPRWKDIDNLIELEKHNYKINLQGQFVFLTLIFGLLILVLQVILNITSWINFIPWVMALAFIAVSAFIIIRIITAQYDSHRYDVDYLYRKKDGQKV